MNTADLAILAVTAVGLADGYWHHRFRMGMADRVRVVNPARQPEPPKQNTASEPARTGPVPLGKAS